MEAESCPCTHRGNDDLMAATELPSASPDDTGAAGFPAPAGPQDFAPQHGGLDPAPAEPEQALVPSADEGVLGPRQLHPLPRGLVELYGFLAVLFVLVPEWMATGALFGFREGREGSELPPPSGAWRRLPELRLASLALAELRELAHQKGLIGYARQNRSELTRRLLKRLRARP